MKNIIIPLIFLLSLTAGAHSLKITHPRIEQKPATTYELNCAKDCTYSIQSREKVSGKIDLSKVATDLKVIEELAPTVSGSRKPIMPERGSLAIQIKESQLYLPPATQWPKEKAQDYAKFSEAISRLEFLMEKGRTKK